jgi:hypothetical protein
VSQLRRGGSQLFDPLHVGCPALSLPGTEVDLRLK